MSRAPPKRASSVRLDVLGAVLGTGALVSLVYGLLRAGASASGGHGRCVLGYRPLTVGVACLPYGNRGPDGHAALLPGGGQASACARAIVMSCLISGRTAAVDDTYWPAPAELSLRGPHARNYGVRPARPEAGSCPAGRCA